jgi:hypothetical protein
MKWMADGERVVKEVPKPDGEGLQLSKSDTNLLEEKGINQSEISTPLSEKLLEKKTFCNSIDSFDRISNPLKSFPVVSLPISTINLFNNIQYLLSSSYRAARSYLGRLVILNLPKLQIMIQRKALANKEFQWIKRNEKKRSKLKKRLQLYWKSKDINVGLFSNTILISEIKNKNKNKKQKMKEILPYKNDSKNEKNDSDENEDEGIEIGKIVEV